MWTLAELAWTASTWPVIQSSTLMISGAAAGLTDISMLFESLKTEPALSALMSPESS